MSQLRGAGDNDIEKAAGFFGQLWSEVLEENFGKAADGAEGSAKVVRNGMSKGFEFLVDPLDFISVLLNALLKIGVFEAQPPGGEGAR